MDQMIYAYFEDLWSTDRPRQSRAFFAFLEATDRPVEWAYEIWDRLLAGLSHKDSHVRAIAAQVLCNLAKSDPEKRLLRDFDALLAVTRDPKFVAARHTMQALWKVGAAGEAQREKLVAALERRFHDAATEKNGTLIRFDISQSLRHIYDAVGDETVRDKALALIAAEEDPKYRQKYARLWKGKGRP
jgi:hypothetical protein